MLKLNNNSNADTRINQASLLLRYLFDYGVDLQRRTINITGEIDENAFNIIDFALSEMESESRVSVTIKINSDGGDMYQALAIVGRLRESKCQIITKGYGQIMSAASLILACGHKRLLSKYAWFMWHEMSYHTSYRKHSEQKDYVIQAEKEQKQWARMMEEFTEEKFAFWMKVGSGKDSYFTPEKLVELGVIDEIF